MADNSKRVICPLFIFKLIFEESTGESVVLCNLGFCGIILAVGALGFAILFAAAGARLESQCAHKDIRIPDTEKLIKQTLLCVLSTILQSEYIRQMKRDIIPTALKDIMKSHRLQEQSVQWTENIMHISI